MTDLAALGLSVRSDGVIVATDRLDGFRGASDRAARGGTRLERSNQRLQAGLRRLAVVAGTVAGTLAAAFSAGAIISGIAQFDQSMSRVAAITRATDGELRALRETAMTLGETTEFSATQAADGLSFLGMAGFSATEAIAALPSVLDLATGAQMGLADASDIASNILSGFGIAAAETSQVTDILAAASTRANTDVRQLGEAMSYAAPVSASLGISIQDTAAAIGVLSDAGIQGQRAGTALRGVMAALAGPTSQARTALARYGLTAADVDPAVRSLSDIMDTLAGVGLSTADAMEIFGREAASGALVMVGASGRLREFGDELRNVDGAASDMAQTMRDNLGGDIQSLQSALAALVLALGDEGLTGVLRTVVQGLTTFVRFISSDVVPLLDELAVVIGVLMVARLAAFTVSLFSAVGGLSALSTSMGVALAAGLAYTRAMTAATAITGAFWTALGGPVGVAIALAGALMLVARANREQRDPARLAAEAHERYAEAITTVLDQQGSVEASGYVQSLVDQKEAALDAARAELALLESRMSVAHMDPEAYLFLGGQQDELVRTIARLRAELVGLRTAADEVLGDTADGAEEVATQVDTAATFADRLQQTIDTLSQSDMGGLVQQITNVAGAMGIAAREAALAVGGVRALAIYQARNNSGGRGGDPRQFMTPSDGQFSPTSDIIAEADALIRSWQGVASAGSGAASATDELTLAQQRALAVIGQMNEDAVTQEDVIGALTELYRSGAISADELAEATRRVREEMAETDAQAFDLNKSLAGVFTDALTGVRSLTDGLRNLLQQMAQLFLNRAFLQLFNSMGTGRGGFLSGLLPGRANGGPVTAGQPYIVGERRPELFIPRQSGTILPSVPSSGGGGGTSVQVINNTGAPVSEERSRGPDGSEIVEIIVGDKISNGRFDKQLGGRMGVRPVPVRR